jgi:hypothetical protein
MKLRLRGNSVRLRLTKSEVSRFAEIGSVEETIEFGLQPYQQLVYTLQSSSEIKLIKAEFESNRLTVFVPEVEGKRWAQTNQIGIENEQSLGEGKQLRILIEKDFACLDQRPGEDESDAFANPMEGKIC